jgi:hypothetical protein
LSAFNLQLMHDRQNISVECAYQGSKVFERGGPFTDLYLGSSRAAKTDDRLRSSGNFKSYEFFGETFPSTPVTAFYDWLYLRALVDNPTLADRLFEYQGFSDIVFNPKKSLNSQARSAALFISLSTCGELQNVLEDRQYYIKLLMSR